MKVCFVAAPLVARSGVYMSAVETVSEGRRLGLDWSLYVGVSKGAAGTPVDRDWMIEETVEPAGPLGVWQLSHRLKETDAVRDSDLVVSLIPQSDMALAVSSIRWVSYLRGLPWPDRGEASAVRRRLWKTLEVQALQRAEARWCTTAILRDEIGGGLDIELVPAGIEPLQRAWDGSGERGRVVWAARYNEDKNPKLFLDVMSSLKDLNGTMYGSGELENYISANLPPNVTVGGWADRTEIYAGALAYVGTSSREAFGRSAVEAAMLGLPVVVSDRFGSADLLYTDPGLKKSFVLPVNEVARWVKALRELSEDSALRMAVSDHVSRNASSLTIASSVHTIRNQIDRLNGAK